MADLKLSKERISSIYDTFVSAKLDWPSATVEWLSRTFKPFNQDLTLPLSVWQRFVCGTQAPNNEQNYLCVYQVEYFDGIKQEIVEDEDDDVPVEEANSHIVVEERNKFLHKGCVNRARVMPQHFSKVATQSSKKFTLLFDIDNPVQPLVACYVHNDRNQGSSLSWSEKHPGYLLSGTESGAIYMLDVNHQPKKMSMAPVSTFSSKTVIGDVKWNNEAPHMFGSVGWDRKLNIWDIRCHDHPVISLNDAHSDIINCLDFNPFTWEYILTGSDDKTISLWDIRNVGNRSEHVGVFKSHQGPVCHVEWSPHNECLFGSSSTDKTVRIWDLSVHLQNEATTNKKNNQDIPRELMFIHSTHDSTVADFSWNRDKKKEFLFVSVCGGNLLQLWQMKNQFNPYSEQFMKPNLKTTITASGSNIL